MPDAADEACPHDVRTLERNDRRGEAEWYCMDCGVIFARMDATEASDPDRLAVFAARNRIPDRKVRSYLEHWAA